MKTLTLIFSLLVGQQLFAASNLYGSKCVELGGITDRGSNCKIDLKVEFDSNDSSVSKLTFLKEQTLLTDALLVACETDIQMMDAYMNIFSDLNKETKTLTIRTFCYGTRE